LAPEWHGIQETVFVKEKNKHFLLENTVKQHLFSYPLFTDEPCRRQVQVAQVDLSWVRH
jgi:hypothetical protein